MINQNFFDWNEKVTTLFKENGFLNICYEALDRQVEGSFRHSTAIRYVPPTWSTERPDIQDISYEKLTILISFQML